MSKSLLSSSISKLSQVMEGEKVIEIALDLIDPDPKQPRKTFDQAGLEELAASIAAKGVVQPIVVMLRESRYLIVFGERRWRSSSLAGKATIPAIVRRYSELDLRAVRLLENRSREAVAALEEAAAIKEYIEELGDARGAQKKAAAELGLSEATISERLALLVMPPEVKAAYLGGHINDATTALDVARVHESNPAAAAALVEKAKAGDFIRTEAREAKKAVREAAKAAKKEKGGAKAQEGWTPHNPAGAVRCDKTKDMWPLPHSNDNKAAPPSSSSLCQNPLSERQTAVLSALLDELAGCDNPSSFAQVVRVALDRGQSFGFDTSEILAAIDGGTTKEPGYGR